jgi:hypothetical protein
MNDAWATERALAIIDANARAMASEVSANHARWIRACGGNYCPPDPGGWRASVATLEQFHRERPAHQRRHLMAFFGLEKEVSVTLQVEPPGAGRVRIATITPEAYPWTGVYFDGNPVTIVAEPAAGYAFAGWAPNGFVADPARPEVTANIDAAATTFTARFERSGAP